MTHTARQEAPAGARLTIDLAAIADNWRLLAAKAGPAETGAAVKADAYGAGLVPVGRALARAGCRTFFVALPAEGVALRAELPDADIFVLNGYLPGSAATLCAHRLSPVLGDAKEIDAWIAEAGPDAPGPALHVDTGMNRLGLTLGEARDLAASAERMAALRPKLVMSHLACADEPSHPLTARQVDRFAAARDWFPDIPGSLANSAGIALGLPALHDLVRPGISLYGGRARAGDDHAVRPVATLEAKILTVREVPPGETVGYGASATTARPSRIAVISVGYADGYPRRLAEAGAMAAVGGARVPLIGRVSMDLIAIDVTDLAPGSVRRCNAVELLGPNVPLAELADRAGTIDYEILTALGRRYERRYSG